MEIDTMNWALVGSLGGELVVMRAPSLGKIDKAKALNLAAYLVTMSGATDEEFAEVKRAVRNT